jgi:transposase
MGRAPQGESAVLVVPTQSGINVSTVAAMSYNGLICWKSKIGSMKSENFVEFLGELFTKLGVGEPPMIVCDNARIHRSDLVKEFLENINGFI